MRTVASYAGNTSTEGKMSNFRLGVLFQNHPIDSVPNQTKIIAASSVTAFYSRTFTIYNVLLSAAGRSNGASLTTVRIICPSDAVVTLLPIAAKCTICTAIECDLGTTLTVAVTTTSSDDVNPTRLRVVFAITFKHFRLTYAKSDILELMWFCKCSKLAAH